MKGASTCLRNSHWQGQINYSVPLALDPSFYPRSHDFVMGYPLVAPLALEARIANAFPLFD